MTSTVRLWTSAVVAILVAVACGGSTVSPSVDASTTPSIVPSTAQPTAPGSPSFSPVRSEGAALPWPSARLIPIPPGRHAISPPFDLPFTIAVPPGWHTAHILGEFTDLAWFDGSTADGVPERVVAFGHPTTLRGEQDVQAAGLTADEAVALYRDRPDLETGEAQPFEIDGRWGLTLDLHAPEFDTRLYSGPGRNGLGIGPDKEVRAIIVPLEDGELLVVTVHADAVDLAPAWEAAAPILASIDFD